MNNLMIYSAILFALYIFVVFYLTYTASKRETPQQYAIGDRKVELWNTVASITAGQRDGSGIVVSVSLVIVFGVSTMWAFAGFALGLLVLALRAKRIRNQSAQLEAITFSDIFKKVIGSKTSVVAALVIAGVAFLTAAAQLNISGVIFSVLFGVPAWVGIITTGAIVGIYLFAGGYQTVIKTDMFQCLIILSILFVPLFLIQEPITNLPFSGIMNMDFTTAFGLAGISFLFTISAADVWQRLFSAKSDRVAKNSALFAVPVYFVIAVGSLALGLVAASVIGDVSDPQTVFFEIFQSGAAPFVLAVLGVFVLATSMSTFDTHTFLFSQVISRNILSRFNIPFKETKLTRYVLVAFLVLLVLLATTISDIVEFVFGAATLITVLAPLLLLYMFDKIPKGKLDTYISSALVLSIVCYGWMFMTGYFENVAYTVVPAILSAVFIGVSIFFHKLCSEKQRQSTEKNNI